MNDLDVLLIVPPGAPGTTPNREGASGLGAYEARPDGFRYAPHTVAQCGAVLRAADCSVEAIDAPEAGDSVEACLERVALRAARVVAVYVSWATREADAAFLAALRARPDITGISVAIGSSVRWIESDLEGADCALFGEPDLALTRLCSDLLVEQRPWPLRVWAQELSPADHTPDGLVANLDALPPPAWDLLPLERYDHLSVLASRGCPERCAWCPYVVSQGHRPRSRSPRLVLEELVLLIEKYRPRRIIFRDPVFALDSERVSSLCHLIMSDSALKPGKTLKWECESRPEHFSRPLLKLMSLAGCMGIKVGLETANEKLLARHGRVPEGETAGYLRRAQELARDCAEVGIACRAYAMVGLPGQTVEMALQTARFVQKMRPTSLSAKALIVYPGLRVQSDATYEVKEVEDQTSPLIDAQRALAQHPRPGPPRWRRALWRMAYRAGALSRRGIG